MNAEILAVGTEILLGDILNTNAQFLSRALAKLGINVYTHTAVGDNVDRLHKAYAQAFARADLVIATGGLGPTDDDITKEVAAAYFGLPLVLHEPSWEAIEARFAQSAAAVTPNNKKQAMLPEGCRVLPNSNGTAPGICIEQDGKTLILLPGPPNEAEPMFINTIIPWLRTRTDAIFVSRTLKLTGIGESAAAYRLKALIDRQTNPTIAPYAKVSEVWLRITAAAPDEAQAQALIAPVADAVYDQLGEYVYGEDDDTPASVVVEKLKARKLTIACAESCTGGLLTARLVDCPGVSAVLREGAVTYANEAKVARLGVSEAVLREYGAVSEQTAEAMAAGIAQSAGTDVGIATTGIAGPEGGTPDKPVGLVYIGLYIAGRGTETKALHLSGNRETIRTRAVIHALDFLRRAL